MITWIVYVSTVLMQHKNILLNESNINCIYKLGYFITEWYQYGFFYALLTTRKEKKNISFLQSKTRLGQQFQIGLKQENNKIKYTF